LFAQFDNSKQQAFILTLSPSLSPLSLSLSLSVCAHLLHSVCQILNPYQNEMTLSAVRDIIVPSIGWPKFSHCTNIETFNFLYIVNVHLAYA